jgi:hypothetical protein
MCSAIAVGIGAQAFGTILKANAQVQQGRAAKTAANMSADASERAAADAIYRGSLKEMQVTMHGSAVVAAQRVAQSGSGLDVNVGGHRAVQTGTEAVTDLDRATVRRNAALEAYGLRERARGFRQQGEYAQAEGENAALGTFLSGIGSAIGQGGRYVADNGMIEVDSRRIEE